MDALGRINELEQALAKTERLLRLAKYDKRDLTDGILNLLEKYNQEVKPNVK